METAGITLRPIGCVETKATLVDFRNRKAEVLSKIMLKRELTKGLKGIEEYSHLFVIFWMHKVPRSETRILLTHPKHRQDLREVGIFSTRQRNHPNAIGLTVVELLGRRSNVLKVKGLDALNGSPVLDIKPYDYRDIPKKIRVPEGWLRFRSNLTLAELDKQVCCADDRGARRPFRLRQLHNRACNRK